MEIYSWFENKSNANSQQQGKEDTVNKSEMLNTNMWPKAQVKTPMMMMKKQESIELIVDSKDNKIDFIQKII
ncbi:hypothetical protein [Thalassotalea atypica]|uniref:hypothetical protein n=1 Tax=Thalassotalea atypica TaxID=2054316 RepID=UPI0025737F9A|nr:hypothetical protein [Thalassotalea atypica]